MTTPTAIERPVPPFCTRFPVVPGHRRAALKGMICAPLGAARWCRRGHGGGGPVAPTREQGALRTACARRRRRMPRRCLWYARHASGQPGRRTGEPHSTPQRRADTGSGQQQAVLSRLNLPIEDQVGEARSHHLLRIWFRSVARSAETRPPQTLCWPTSQDRSDIARHWARAGQPWQMAIAAAASWRAGSASALAGNHWSGSRLA